MRLLPLALILGSAASLAAFGGGRAACDPDNGGLTLPDGFCATLFAELSGPRHLVVAPNGDLFVAQQGRSGGGMTVLRDADGDGHADRSEQVVAGSATGVAFANGSIFLGFNDRIVRYPWQENHFGLAGEGVEVVTGLPTGGGHGATTLTIGADGALYVDHGSASNACAASRGVGVAGQRPCAELPTRAGIWRYDATATGQTPATGRRWATGLRNAMALAIEPTTGVLWAAVHGRDQLKNWPGFSDEDNAEKPSEEFGPVTEGADYGWPYCYHDPIAGRKVLAPEYGGDGVVEGECADKTQPAIGFPGHWAPLALAFYSHASFGPAYQGGAFLAFRGSWNRAPLPQAGYRVVFIPFRDGQPTGEYSTFATATASVTGLRASGVAIGPDGSLYIASDGAGKIWRVTPAR
jgi:glucose/arabinose dehydrogenase